MLYHIQWICVVNNCFVVHALYFTYQPRLHLAFTCEPLHLDTISEYEERHWIYFMATASYIISQPQFLHLNRKHHEEKYIISLNLERFHCKNNNPAGDQRLSYICSACHAIKCTNTVTTGRTYDEICANMLDNDLFLCFYVQVSMFASILFVWCDTLSDTSSINWCSMLCDTLSGNQADILNITFKWLNNFSFSCSLFSS